MNHLREQWAALVTAASVEYEFEDHPDETVIVRARLLDGPVPYVGYVNLHLPPSGIWFVEGVATDPDYRGEGIATGMLLAFHEKYPDAMVEHGHLISYDGEMFASRMVTKYPSWNRYREASMGTPSVGFPEGFVFTPPLYRSMLSPGQRVIITHPDMGDAEVGGIITGEIPTAGIMVVRLDGMKAPNVVHIPLSMVRTALSSNDPEKWKLKQDAWTRKRPSVKQTKQVGQFTLHYHPYVPYDNEFHTEFDITVTEGDKVVGSFFFAHDGNSFQGAMEVHPDYRRQGIATAAYSWAEQLSGYKLDPSYPHSEMAESFWSQPGRPFG